MATIKVFPAPLARGFRDDFLRERTGTGKSYTRIHPGTGKPYHGGIDIWPSVAGKIGEPLLAVWDGVISHRSGGPAYGKQITVIADRGFGAFYAHCHELLVPERMFVTAGAKIATMGNTGSQTTGAHLHFEKRRKWDDWLTVVNPYQELVAAKQGLVTPTSEEEDEMAKARTVWQGDRGDLFVIGTDRALHHAFTTNGGATWSDFDRLGGTISEIVSAHGHGGRYTVLVVGEGNAVYRQHYDGQRWTGFVKRPGGAVAG